MGLLGHLILYDTKTIVYHCTMHIVTSTLLLIASKFCMCNVLKLPSLRCVEDQEGTRRTEIQGQEIGSDDNGHPAT
jgi:hypothetical protein